MMLESILQLFVLFTIDTLLTFENLVWENFSKHY